ncbi:SusC/RagA family TonB-linked outer membrane protein [Mucilaginibacter sp. HMF5004]|uniref:SusC/RagA family TonB-linked outer membrane protein n=1 Tax=Mucilaginibacter rivuli TaxID=2857527 RepID=UPI001C5E2D1B|nr:SusC/RagA family TonB-linked outer membrane protein [Mucilaginibacter rivuli]MBW4890041.1 SusC/RagA family TonB-linked outer membrane protein [Mucilaginibacter rivuli]
MKKLLLVSLCVLFCYLQTFAQNRTVSGTVIAKEDGTPIPGVGVKIKGTTIGVVTGVDGKYSINVPASGTTLVFTFIGYAPQEKLIVSNTVNVTLELSNKQLGEVVVTALGITRESKSLGYSVGVIKGDDLTQSRETNVVNSLAGKLAGVNVTSSSGTLGGGSKIVLRGATSLGSDIQPIFVVDGLPIDNQAQQLSTVNGVAQGTSSVDFGNRASDINEDDIESITVLKGAAASALYGTRAKNGAIIITTKRGKKGAATIDINSSIRFDNVLVLPDYQNEYAQGNHGLYGTNANPTALSASINGWGPKISEVQGRTFTNFLNQQVALQAYPDNVKDFFKTGKTVINSVAMGGADETGDYRITFDNTIQRGTIEQQELNKNAISFNGGKKLPYGFDIRTNLNYTRTVGDGLAVQSSNNPNVLTSLIFGLPRTIDINQLRDNYIDPVTGQQNALNSSKNSNNPYWIINNNKFGNSVDRFFGNAILSYKPTSWLTLSDNIGTDFYTEFRKGVTRPGTIGALTGNFFTGNIYNRVINNDFLATLDTKVTKDLALKFIAGYNVYEAYYRRDQSDAQTLTVDQLYNFSNAASVTTTNTSNLRRLQGVYGDLGLSYKSFLYVDVTARNDWSSTLPKINNSYFYPSVSAGFVFSELLPANKWLSYGKLRASYANVGGDTSPYQLAFTYAPVSTAFAQYGYGSSFPFNGLIAFGIPSTVPPLDLLKPQDQKTNEIGTELRFLNDRVRLDVTYYNSKTSNQIISLGLPQSSGYAAKLINAGSITNNGWEVQLGVTPVKLKTFSWDIDANWSRNTQTIDLPAEAPLYVVQSGWSGLQLKAEPGTSVGIYGTAWVRDPDGNIVIDPATGLRKTVLDKRLGSVNPDWVGGITNTVRYKGFALSFLIQARKGGIMYSNTVSTLRTTGLAQETALNRGNIFIDKGVVASGSTFIPNTVPVQSMQDYWGQYSTTNTEANIFDASFVKLKQATLKYTFPQAFLDKHAKYFKGLTIGVEGRNIWIISKNVPYIDPEVNFFGSGAAGDGVEFNSQPSTRTIGFNLGIKF